jgi:hypothetical protein
MKNFRDIEHLSSYLDGQLKASESARLESRLNSDPELVSVLNDLRAARGVLRKLPKRKAPRNFMLTRQMVGLKPPLPKAYPVFRFATAFTTVLLFMTFVLNILALPLSTVPEGQNFGSGGGYGGFGGYGGVEDPGIQAAPMEEPAAEAMELPAPVVEGEQDTAREYASEDASEKETAPLEEQARVQRKAPVPWIWQIGLMVVAILSGALMWLMRQFAAKKWK